MGIDTLLQHLEEEASREAATVRQEADMRAADIVARSEVDAARQRSLHLAQVTEQRRVEHERRLAATRAQAREQFLRVRMDMLERVFADATSRLTRMPVEHYAASISALAADAMRYLEGSPAVLQSPPDAAAAVAAAVHQLPGVGVVPAEVSAGVTGRSADGRVIVDNSLVAILARRRADLAIDLATRIEEG